MSNTLSWDTWAELDATAMAQLIRQGDISASEAAHQVDEAVTALNPKYNGVIEVFADAVADPAANGANLDGYFAGVPFFMKDLGTPVKGRLQEMGSKLMQGHRSTDDGFLTRQIRAAGLNILGRTTTPEFGLCSSAENPEMYVTRNPWNLDYTTCGSSAGTAASVAAGVVPMSHGTDGGGSVRIPAGVNGCIGLKPTRGTLSVGSYSSDYMNAVSTQGCLTRSIRDMAGFIDHCRGGAPGEFMPFWQPPEAYTELITRDPAPLRIALSHAWGDYRAAPEIVAELEKTGKLLESLGHHVEWIKPDIDFYLAYKAQTDAYILNFAQTINDHLATTGYQTPPADLVEPMCIKVWEKGKDASYSERVKTQKAFNMLSRGLARFFNDWDIVLTPTMALPTPKIGTTKYLTINDDTPVDEWFVDLWAMVAYTPIANITGTPGISLPIGVLENGLPFGMHALAGLGNDGLLLQLGAQIERALDGKWNNGQTPAVHVSSIG